LDEPQNQLVFDSLFGSKNTQDPLCGRVFEAPFQVQAFDDFGLGVQLVPWIAVASIDGM